MPHPPKPEGSSHRNEPSKHVHFTASSLPVSGTVLVTGASTTAGHTGNIAASLPASTKFTPVGMSGHDLDSLPHQSFTIAQASPKPIDIFLDSRDLYRLCSSMYDEYYQQYSHTKYSCDRAAVTDLKDPRSGLLNPFAPQLSLQDAARRLRNFNDPSGKMSATRSAILKRISDPQTLDYDENPCWRADIIFRMFGDLDNALFEGKLKGNVFLTWDDTDSDTKATTVWPGLWGEARDQKPGRQVVGRRICICMYGGPLLLREDPTLHRVLRCLIHQMVHAYLCLLSGAVPCQDSSKEELEDYLGYFEKCVNDLWITLNRTAENGDRSMDREARNRRAAVDLAKLEREMSEGGW